MSTFKFLNLDSIDSHFSTAQTNNSYPFDYQSIYKCPNSFNTEWQLRIPLKNPKKIILKSVEIPITFSNIRSTKYF